MLLAGVVQESLKILRLKQIPGPQNGGYLHIIKVGSRLRGIGGRKCKWLKE